MEGQTQDKLQQLIGSRIKVAREEQGINQEELSKKLGFKDRQILSNVEAGRRKIAVAELMVLIKLLQKPLEYFTDSFVLTGEASFSWRASASDQTLSAFEAKAGKWIALFRRLGELLNEKTNTLVPQLPITKRSSFEEAQEYGERLSQEWELGEAPARKLAAAIEERLGSLVMFIDAPQGVSGAACKLPTLNTILVNRNEPEGRRSYDLAHELFHILTWDKLPPNPIDPYVEAGAGRGRTEQLAENFAGALLMPREIIRKFTEREDFAEIHAWLNSHASQLGVSSKALRWRMKNLGLLPKEIQFRISDERLTWNGAETSRDTRPKRFSHTFVQRLHRGLDNGLISVGKAAEQLDLSKEDLAKLFQEHELDAPFAY